MQKRILFDLSEPEHPAGTEDPNLLRIFALLNSIRTRRPLSRAIGRKRITESDIYEKLVVGGIPPVRGRRMDGVQRRRDGESRGAARRARTGV